MAWWLGLVGCVERVEEEQAEGIAAAEAGWELPAEVVPPPVVATIDVPAGVVAGLPFEVVVDGVAPGVWVTLLIGRGGTGVGPCSPRAPTACTDLLAPLIVGSKRAPASGTVRFDPVLRVAGPVDFQAVVLDPTTPGTTPVGGAVATRFDTEWPVADLLEVTVAWGESGYDFGMAETGAGPFGWYGEDCFAGTAPYYLCHQIVGGSLQLDSVHPGIGGPGITYVVEDVTTLFYDIHHPAITYYFAGWDSGECWTFGDDPGYYVSAFGCTEL